MKSGRSDVLSVEQRSRCMAANRGQNTTPEVLLRKACWAEGIRYRLGAKLPGRPDFTMPKYLVAVFVDGCFWHGCPIHYQEPATRGEFWAVKVNRNCSRDLVVNQQLRTMGWTVVRIWEHTVRRDLNSAVLDIRRHCGLSACATSQPAKPDGASRNKSKLSVTTNEEPTQ